MYFMNKDRSSESAANEISSIVYIISAVASPICGALVDKFGKNVFWVILSIVTTGGCHLLMALTYVSPIYPMVGKCQFFLLYSNFVSTIFTHSITTIPSMLSISPRNCLVCVFIHSIESVILHLFL